MYLAEGIAVDSFGLSDIGKKRSSNQDQFLVAGLHKVIDVAHTSIPDDYQQKFAGGARAMLHLVADGVGGGQGGEEASMLSQARRGAGERRGMVLALRAQRWFFRVDPPATVAFPDQPN